MKEPGLPEKTLNALAEVFAGYPELAEVVLFGSRARGTATPRSDIDLATSGILDPHRLGRLALDLEDTDILQKCDVQAYEHIENPVLRAHIDSEGVSIYRKGSPQ